MSTTPDLQKHLRRKRRWLVPVVIASLLLAMASLAYLTLASTSITIEEAEALCASMDEIGSSSDEARVRFGKPFRQSTGGNSASSVWVFTRQSFNSIDLLNVVMIDGQQRDANTLALGRETVHGWDAWVFRWELLKHRLGLK